MTLAFLCVSLIATTPTADLPLPPDVTQTYQEAKARAGRSPEEQVKLALWCEAHGLTAQRLHHLTLAILADPKNAAARGLMGLVSHNGRWQRPEVVADKAKADSTLAEYQAKRLKAAYTADAQLALGLWCEEHGLKEQAKAHLTAVIRLDPSRENAWKKLGYKRHEGRWVTDAQLAADKAEVEAQKLADRRWRPLLERYKAMLDQPSRREEAESALATITDPRAVPSIGQVFAKAEATQSRAVQLLGQIDAPSASKALAFLAVFARSAEARRTATETLRNRDPREYANLLIAMIRDPIKYEVRPVGGPGSPGTLLVEGERYNVQRRFSPSTPPNIAAHAGDQIIYDPDGLPVIDRFWQPYVQEQVAVLRRDQARATAFSDYYDSFMNPHFVDFLSSIGHPLLRTSADRAKANSGYAAALTQIDQQLAIPIRSPLTVNAHRFVLNQMETMIPVGQMMVDSQMSALVARQQLADEVAVLERHNEIVKTSNGRIVEVLNGATGQNLPPDSKKWKEWWVDQLGFQMQRMTADPTNKPTLFEEVPIDYVSQAAAPTSRVNELMTSHAFYRRISCFGAGTPVRTIDGVRPIESLKVGDLVLTQSTGTGALGYKPVLVVHHNPPSATFRIKLSGEAIISSHFHRFWVAGRGWVMARDLKAGDPIRTLGGVVPVEAVEADKVQLVYNLDVADDADFFAGQLGALVHDNTLPDPRLAPFDAPARSQAVDVARRGDD